MTSSESIPAAILKRKAVVYVRQSSPSQVLNNLESQRRQYDLVEVARTVWLRGYVRAKSGLSCALMPRGSPGMAETGTICSNCAGWSKRGLLISTVSITRVGRTTGFFWV